MCQREILRRNADPKQRPRSIRHFSPVMQKHNQNLQRWCRQFPQFFVRDFILLSGDDIPLQTNTVVAKHEHNQTPNSHTILS
jgi:hypothetical protein